MNTTGTERDANASYLIVMMEVSNGAKMPFVKGRLLKSKALSEIWFVWSSLLFVFPT